MNGKYNWETIKYVTKGEAYVWHLYTHHMEEAPRVEDTRGLALGACSVARGWVAGPRLWLSSAHRLPSPCLAGARRAGQRLKGWVHLWPLEGLFCMNLVQGRSEAWTEPWAHAAQAEPSHHCLLDGL